MITGSYKSNQDPNWCGTVKKSESTEMTTSGWPPDLGKEPHDGGGVRSLHVPSVCKATCEHMEFQL